nr:hypothetical protein BaRGS_025623 [Batillaria attramentaria]
MYPSAISVLPDSIREQFRVVSIMTLDFQLSLEVMLFSQGFVHGRELAYKTKQLYRMCRQMFGTNTFITDKAILGQENSGSFYGWSLHTLKGVAHEAGAHMVEKMGMDDKVRGAVSQFKKLDSEAAKKLAEESALVIALRDTFMPRLNARDASLFATIVQDIWPKVDVPMVFGGDLERQPKVHQTDSLQTIKSELRIRSSKSADSNKSLKGFVSLR